MRLGLAADHGGFEMKQQVAKLLEAEGHEIHDFGNHVVIRKTIIRTLRSRSLEPSRAEMWNAASSCAAAAWAHRWQQIRLSGCGPRSVTMSFHRVRE